MFRYTEDTRIAKAVKIWLITGLLMVFMQIVIGGITRLTGSGLSITRWEIVTGTLPPLNDGAVAGRVRFVPTDTAVPEDQSGHAPGRFQVHLFLGVFPPAVGTADVFCFCHSLLLFFCIAVCFPGVCCLAC
ncbi:MAG: COX15/CtaA family protein [Dermatophilaceae bacterium]